ncbi:hypothetical protein VRK_11090 [Vibrio sp. MEBiC08052]|nr:hypothetical protein VRK_11090 [Vibrio sp. MEBiC08052]
MHFAPIFPVLQKIPLKNDSDLDANQCRFSVPTVIQLSTALTIFIDGKKQAHFSA